MLCLVHIAYPMVRHRPRCSLLLSRRTRPLTGFSHTHTGQSSRVLALHRPLNHTSSVCRLARGLSDTVHSGISRVHPNGSIGQCDTLLDGISNHTRGTNSPRIPAHFLAVRPSMILCVYLQRQILRGAKRQKYKLLDQGPCDRSKHPGRSGQCLLQGAVTIREGVSPVSTPAAMSR
jgi:hypothetical protein